MPFDASTLSNWKLRALDLKSSSLDDSKPGVEESLVLSPFSRIILKFPVLVTLAGLLLTVWSGKYTVLLYKNLRTNLEELLPNTARAVVDYDEVKSRLRSTDSLTVLVFSKDVKASFKFVNDLAKELEKLPPTVVASVEYHINRELKFFSDRKSLYIDTPDLENIQNFISKRIDFEKELYNPLNIFRTHELPEPFYDFDGLQNKYGGRTSGYDHLPGGYYATEAEDIRALIVNLPGKVDGINGAKSLRKAVDDVIAGLKPQSYAEDLSIKYSGNVQNLIEEHASLIADLELTTIIVVILTALALLIYYRTWRGTFAMVVSLLMGTIWTFGISFFTVGYLNANTAFLGGIVIGNGINYGIIFLARYMEERRNGTSHEAAIDISMTKTFTATLTAALAAGLAYGSLILTGFRGFNQFGVIGLVGMVLCWISAYTVFPAMLTIFDRWRSFGKARIVKGRFNPFTDFFIWLAEKHYRKILWISGAAVLLSILGFFARSEQMIELDLRKLRDKRSMTEGSGYNAKYADRIFKRYLTPIVIMPREEENTLKIVELLRSKMKEKEPGAELINRVYSIHDFLPTDQEQRIEVLKKIRGLLPKYMVDRLSPEDQKLVKQFLHEKGFSTVKKEDLPPLILQKFSEQDGTIGRLVLVEPPLGSETHQGDNMIHFIELLRNSADSIEKGAPVAGQMPIVSDMVRAIRNDGPKATFFAFLAVAILVLILFQSPRIVGLCLVTLLLGVGWLTGIIMGFDLKINFLNFIALPITFGIGVDYGVNVFQRYRLDGRGSILKVLRRTGGAVGLASFTTIVGYGALLLAGNQAFVSFGLLAVLGEITCLFAAVVTLPAYLYYRDRKFLQVRPEEAQTSVELAAAK